MKTILILTFLVLINLVGCNPQSLSQNDNTNGSYGPPAPTPTPGPTYNPPPALADSAPINDLGGYPILINVPTATLDQTIKYRGIPYALDLKDYIPYALKLVMFQSLLSMHNAFLGPIGAARNTACSADYNIYIATFQSCLTGCASNSACQANCINTGAVQTDYDTYTTCTAPYDATQKTTLDNQEILKQILYSYSGLTMNYLSFCITTESVGLFPLANCVHFESIKSINILLDKTYVDSLGVDLVIFFTYGNPNSTNGFLPFYLNDNDGKGDYVYFMYYQLPKTDIQSENINPSGIIPLVSIPVKVYTDTTNYDFGTSLL